LVALDACLLNESATGSRIASWPTGILSLASSFAIMDCMSLEFTTHIVC